MKPEFLIISISLLTLSALGCEKENHVPYYPPPAMFVPIYSPCDTSFGVASAIKLTENWKAGVTCRSYLVAGKKKWLIEFSTCTTDGSIRELMTFGRIPDENPEQKFETVLSSNTQPESVVSASYNTASDDGDVAEDHYLLDTSSIKNYVTIEKWDLANKRAEGRFYLSFDIREPRVNPKNPKSVTFSAGRFWVAIP